MRSVTPWRTASRLARREVRRRPGRTLLITVLVAIPVMAMTIGSVMYRTNDRNDRTGMPLYPPGADLRVIQPYGSERAIGSALPETATVAHEIHGHVAIESEDRRIHGNVGVTTGAGAGGADERFRLSGGRLPGAGEVWVTEPLRERLGVEVGDELALLHPAGTWTVVGTGVLRREFGLELMLLPDLPVDQFRDGVLEWVSYVDLGDDPTRAEVDRVAATLSEKLDGGEVRVGPFVESRVFSGWVETPGWWLPARGPDASLAWGWVAGAIALAAMGIVVAAGFATSARRQLTTIGQLSSSGASERVIRRSLMLQGSWSGLVGSVIGVSVGVGLLLGFGSTVERINGSELLPFEISARDIIVIVATGVAAATVAALVPARSASKTPVVAALAGRRPIGEVPRKLVPRGVGLFALGTLLLAVVAGAGNVGSLGALTAVIGGLMVLAGMCCCSPMAIDQMSRIAARPGSSWRFFARSLGRTRARSAAVVTAIAVAAAVATAGSTFAERVGEEVYRDLPRDAVVITPWGREEESAFEEPLFERGAVIDDGPLVDRPIAETLRVRIDAVVPEARWHPLRVATWDPAPVTVDEDEYWYFPESRASLIVADPDVLDLFELSAADRESLATVGALNVHSFQGLPPDQPTVHTTFSAEDGEITITAAIRDADIRANEAIAADRQPRPFTEVRGPWFATALITEDAAREAGLDVVVHGGFLRSDSPLSSGQRYAVQEIVGVEDLGWIYGDVEQRSGGWEVQVDWPYRPVSAVTLQAVIVGIALVLTMLVVAIGLALSAAEGRDERDVLVALGARLRTLRSMAAIKALVMTATAVALAVPVGLIPSALVLRGIDQPFRVPWLAVGGLLLVVPLVAGAAAWLVSNVAQRIRTPQMSTLLFE